jgi:hypothetical protein
VILDQQLGPRRKELITTGLWKTLGSVVLKLATMQVYFAAKNYACRMREPCSVVTSLFFRRSRLKKQCVFKRCKLCKLHFCKRIRVLVRSGGNCLVIRTRI